jgi:hypothetical protein
MKIKTFETMLDRWGANVAVWPKAEAEKARLLLSHSDEARKAHETLLRLESLIKDSRPDIAPERVNRVVSRVLLDIARRRERPSFMEWLRLLLTAPIPRIAFAASLTAIGFAIGLAVGNPAGEPVADSNNVPMMTASADDVVF